MTETVRVIPLPVTVTVALLELVDELALLAVTVTLLLFELLAGDTVNQLALSLTLQLTLELTLNWSLLPELDPIVKLVGDTVKMGVVPD